MAYKAPSIGPAGLTIPSYQDILQDNLQGYLNIYGQNQYVGVDSAIYQLLSIISLKMSDLCQGLQFVYNQRSPQTAVGVGLDGVIELNGIARLPYTNSTASETITGTSGTIIVNGIIQDVNGNQWQLPATVTIPGGGSIVVTVTCLKPGNITAGAGEISIITTPVGGWASATNAAAAVPGNPIETDSNLRARQKLSVALPSHTMLAGTVAAIAAVPGVTRYLVLENQTGSTDSYGNLGHSVTAVVQGGADIDIANAIYKNRSIGCNTQAATATSMTIVIVTDPDTGITLPIGFIRPTLVPIYVSARVHGLQNFTTATATAIQAALVSYLNSLQIGELVTQSALYGAALAVMPDLTNPQFSIYGLTLGTAPAPSGTSDIVLPFYKLAEGLTGNVIVTTV